MINKWLISLVKKASSFRMDDYKNLYKITKGTGTERHHLLEKRFAKMFGVDPDRIVCVQLTKDQHRIITKAFRDVFAYGKTNYVWSLSFIPKMTVALFRAYKGYHSLLFAAILSMLN